jgi:hypothetical protein
MAETILLHVSVRKSFDTPEDSWDMTTFSWEPEHRTLGELRDHMATKMGVPPSADKFRPEIWTFYPATGKSVTRLDAHYGPREVLILTSQTCPRELAQNTAFVLFTFPPSPVAGLCF